MIKTISQFELIGTPERLKLAQPNCPFSSLEPFYFPLFSFLFPLSSALLKVHP